MEFYAGIGSRDTPPEVLSVMRAAAAILAWKGWGLRSGGAQGADQAFEAGCVGAGGAREIILPWRGFEGHWHDIVLSDPRAMEIAERFHPTWEKCSERARRLHGRNTHQILGPKLGVSTPTAGVLCWTESGRGGGGTGQALRLAKAFGIPVVDLGDPKRKGQTARDVVPELIELMKWRKDTAPTPEAMLVEAMEYRKAA